MSDTINISSNLLFPVVETLSPRLAWMKRHGVLTHYHAESEQPWMAALPFADDNSKDIGAIMAESCRIYDEAGRCGYGATEEEAVCDLAMNCGLKLWNEEAGA